MDNCQWTASKLFIPDTFRVNLEHRCRQVKGQERIACERDGELQVAFIQVNDSGNHIRRTGYEGVSIVSSV